MSQSCKLLRLGINVCYLVMTCMDDLRASQNAAIIGLSVVRHGSNRLTLSITLGLRGLYCPFCKHRVIKMGGLSMSIA